MTAARRALALAALVAVLLPAAAHARPDGVTRKCRAQDRFLVELRATGVGCPAARAVSLRWARTGACFRTTDAGLVRARACRVRGGWRCAPRRLDRGARVRCRGGARTVSFTSTEA